MSPSVGDSFSLQHRQDFAKRGIQPRAVILCPFAGAQKKKDKRFVVIGISSSSDRVGVLIFNSNKPFIGDKRLEPLQKHFKARGNPYLDYDSYLNCAHLEIISYKVLFDELVAHPEHYLEKLSQTDFDMTCTDVANARTVSPKNIKEFDLTGYILKK
jgi:hypothetical protein